MAKYILITPNRENGILSLNEAYSRAAAGYGLIPVINGCFSNASDYIPIISGVILSGGGDLGKNLLNEPIHKAASQVDDERDLFEINIIKAAVERKIPILGICRGAQVLNSALGGELNQHIDNHKQNKPRNEPSHNIYIKRGSKLYDILKKTQTSVNSIHHQCILKASPFLKISAFSDDNRPEAVEWAQEDYFCIGVQWHPEALNDGDSQKLFEAFINECIIVNNK